MTTTSALKNLLRPTLVQRVFLALLVAFVLVWLALLAFTYLQHRQAIAVDQGLKKLGRAISASLVELDDDATARTVMRATATQFRTLRIDANPGGSVLMQLRDRQGGVVYASPALGTRVLTGVPQQVVDRPLNGETYWVYASDAGRWSLTLAEPRITDAWIVKYNSRRMLPYLLLAFPFVLLPVWFAVKHGLRPLQRLADHIAGRDANELAPIGLDPKYAELKPLVVALERLLQQLRHKLERERAFVQDAAHELRTPMAVIAAQAHALVGAGNTRDREQAQAQLEQAIARSSHLAQQLLELASLDDAQRSASSSVDLAQHVRQLLAQAAPRAFKRGIDLTFEAPDNLMARVDVPAFQSILENLLNNAIRYVSDGAQVAVALSGDELGITLSVRDDGPGIADAERERVFERFYRGPGQEASGSGLGLAIVKQAAGRMGGRVTLAEGLENRGAGFTVWLPAGHAAAAMQSLAA